MYIQYIFFNVHVYVYVYVYVYMYIKYYIMYICIYYVDWPEFCTGNHGLNGLTH